MKFARTYVAVATLFGVPLILPLAADAQQGRIEGTVVVGTAPVDDADVSIAALGRRIRVDAAGRFTFENLPSGTYVIEAESPRWGRGVESVRVIPGGTARVEVALEAIFHLDEMVVSAGAGATRRSEAYQPASVVTSRDLVAMGEATLGETLSGEPGVSSSFFGAGSSRPVIRGIGGDRVRILESGIGTGDASSTSPDHAVSTEARGAERIEVVRGPATLLYGSSAVGGIVNVFDGKIAREAPTQPLSGYLEGVGGTVADERTGSAGVTLRTGPIVLHASGLWRDASDYSIPGFAEADHDEEEHGEGEHEDEVEGLLENSAVESRRGAFGATLVGDRGYLGIAFTGQRSDYGVPGHGHEEEHSADEHEEEEEESPVMVDLDQNRFDLEGALRFNSGNVRNLKARLGVADYEHVELEGTEVGTQFFNDYVEGRLESEHGFGEGLHGAVGAQFSTRDFEAIGDEAFVPPSETNTFALFGYEEWAASERVRIQGGLRWERQSVGVPTTALDRTDSGVSTSLGMNADLSDVLSVAVSGSRSIKLPNAEELFSNGPHAATRSFEVGDPNLRDETAWGLDATAHVHGDRFRGSASFYTTRFDDYIYQEATGDLEDGLPVFQYVQGDARFRGVEVEGEIDVVEGDPAANAPHLSLTLMGDYVRAELTAQDENLPRIPPLRFGGGVNFRQGPLVLRSTIRRTTEQTNAGRFETRTAGFTMVDASVSLRLFSGNGLFHDITLVGRNLADTEARLHTSFLKDLAPLPGREVRLVYRLNF